MNKKRISVLLFSAAGASQGSMWALNLVEPLRSLGHEVEVVRGDSILPGKRLKAGDSKSISFFSDYLLKRFASNRIAVLPSLCLSYLSSAHVYPDVLKTISERVPTINYSTNLHQFELYQDVAKHVHLNVYATRAAKNAFDSLGVRSYWMPFAANPDYFNPAIRKHGRALFAGTAYGDRPYLLWRLLQNGIQLDIYGDHWAATNRLRRLLRVANIGLRALFCPDKAVRSLHAGLREFLIALLQRGYPEAVHESLTDEAYCRLIAEAALVLNFPIVRGGNEFLDHRLLSCTNLRDFEVPMAGTLLVTQRSQELPLFFRDGEEVVSFSGEEEMIDKVSYYIRNSNAASKIACAGRERALRDHTWQRRLKDLLQYVDEEVLAD